MTLTIGVLALQGAFVEHARALARLGVRAPGAPLYDLHQSNFDIDEDCLAIGVRFTAALLDEFWASGAKPA